MRELLELIKKGEAVYVHKISNKKTIHFLVMRNVYHKEVVVPILYDKNRHEVVTAIHPKQEVLGDVPAIAWNVPERSQNVPGE